MVDRPDEFPRWAEDNLVDPISGQNNVIEPPEEKKKSGFNRLEYPPRQWFNWLGRKTGQWIEYLTEKADHKVVTDGNGVGLFPVDDALIEIYAVDNTTPANYVVAVGYKESGQAPVLNVIDNNVLTLGTGNVVGDQPISGGTAGDIIVTGKTSVIPS